MIEKDKYKSVKGYGEGIYLTPYKWSATERRLLKVESKKYKPFRAFELNYSKWATYNIDKFEDITILRTFSKGDYFYEKGDYKVLLSGESCLEEAQDTMYESWCGNLDVRKQFKNCMENGVMPVLFLIIGYPTETEEDFQKTMKFLKDSRKYIDAV